MLLNILLLSMLLSYAIPIFLVYTDTNSKTSSVSSIINSTKNNYTILFCMTLMGFFTLLYEYYRNKRFSLSIVAIILIGIYGVIMINEKNNWHYVFAIITFVFILIFMAFHCYLTKNILLILLFIIQILLSLILCLLLYLRSHFYKIQVYLIINFAIFFMFLHIISFC